METTICTLPAAKTIALIAHDGKKQALVRWCQQNRQALEFHTLMATGTTGTRIEAETGLKVEKMLSGPLGGDQQIGALVAEKRVHAIVFFWDPLAPLPHDPDVKALLRIAAVWNIPVACNECTADLLIQSAAMSQAMDYEVPDYDRYLQKRSD